MNRRPEIVEGRVRSVSVCQPAAQLRADTLETIVETLRVPALFSFSASDSQTERAKSLREAIPRGTATEWKSIDGQRLYGRNQVFDGAKYFSEKPDGLLSFLEDHVPPPPRRMNRPMTAAARMVSPRAA